MKRESSHCQVVLVQWRQRNEQQSVMHVQSCFVSQNNEMAAMLVSQTNPLGVELFSYANASFCSNKFAQMLLATWVKTLLFFAVLLAVALVIV